MQFGADRGFIAGCGSGFDALALARQFLQEQVAHRVDVRAFSTERGQRGAVVPVRPLAAGGRRQSELAAQDIVQFIHAQRLAEDIDEAGVQQAFAHFRIVGDRMRQRRRIDAVFAQALQQGFAAAIRQVGVDQVEVVRLR